MLNEFAQVALRTGVNETRLMTRKGREKMTLSDHDISLIKTVLFYHVRNILTQHIKYLKARLMQHHSTEVESSLVLSSQLYTLATHRQSRTDRITCGCAYPKLPSSSLLFAVPSV